jgi:CheY-like chemotaxis protein
MSRILWVEDDFYHVKGLFRPLEKEGYDIVNSTSANDAYNKIQHWQEYDVVVLDIILPLRDQKENDLSPNVENWRTEEYTGIGLLKYMYHELHVKVPVIVLSVVADELTNQLKELGVSEVLLKRGILPRQIQEAIKKGLEKNKS